MDFKKDVRINKRDLVSECLKFSSVYYTYSKLEERYQVEVEKLERERRVVKARAELQIRALSLKDINEIFDQKLPKLTEQAFKNLVYLHPDVEEVTDRLNEKKKEFADATAARKSLEKKKAMLDYLVDLHRQGYWSNVSGKHTKTDRVFLEQRKRLKI